MSEYTVFLSSADDAAKLRKRFKGLVEETVNPVLVEAEANARLNLDMWERKAPRRLAPGETVDDEFVRRAERQRGT